MPFAKKKLLKNLNLTNSPSDKHFIIVGAGMAGLYTSYRLHQMYKDIKITFMETLERVGGRLLSVDIGDGDFIEKGGMRILTGDQPLIENLVKELDVTLYNPPPSNANNFDYYRGVKVYPKQILSGNIPFNLTPKERGKTGEELVDMGIQLIQKQNNISAAQYNQGAGKLDFWESIQN